MIIFGADISSCGNADNKKKIVLILDLGPTHELDDTTLTAEKKYSITFTVSERKFCLSFHYNGASSYLFVNGTEIITFKAKGSEIVATTLCLGIILDDFTADNIRDRIIWTRLSLMEQIDIC